MSYENTLAKVIDKKTVEIETAIIETGLALLGGGNHKLYLLRKKNKAISKSVAWHAYDDLLKAKKERLIRMVDVFLDGVKI